VTIALFHYFSPSSAISIAKADICLKQWHSNIDPNYTFVLNAGTDPHLSFSEKALIYPKRISAPVKLLALIGSDSFPLSSSSKPSLFLFFSACGKPYSSGLDLFFEPKSTRKEFKRAV